MVKFGTLYLAFCQYVGAMINFKFGALDLDLRPRPILLQQIFYLAFQTVDVLYKWYNHNRDWTEFTIGYHDMIDQNQMILTQASTLAWYVGT